MGVAIKDQNGNIRSTDQILLDLSEKFSQMKDGIIKTGLAMKIFGKGGAEMVPFLNQGKDGIVQLQTEADKLGLQIGTKFSNDAQQFNDNLTRLKAAGQGLWLKISQDLLPSISAFVTGILNVRLEAGQASNVLSRLSGDRSFQEYLDLAVIGVARLIDGLMNLPQILATVSANFRVFTSEIKAYLAQTRLALALLIKPSDVGDALSSYNTAKTEKDQAASDKVAADIRAAAGMTNKYENAVSKAIAAKNAQRAFDANLVGPPSNAAGRAPDSAADAAAKKLLSELEQQRGGTAKGEKGRSREWEAELAAKRDAFERSEMDQGKLREFSKQQESAYWKNLLDTTKMSVNERAIVLSKYYAVEKDIRKAAFDKEIAELNGQKENFKTNFDQRIAIAEQVFNKIVARYGAESVEAKKANAEILKERKALADQTLRIDQITAETRRNIQLADIDQNAQQLQADYDARLVTYGQLLQAEQIFERQRYEIKLQALQEREALLKNDPDTNLEAMAQLNAQKEQMAQQHQLRLGQIQSQINLKNQGLFDGIGQAFSSSLDNMIMRAQTFRQTMAGLFQSLSQSLIRSLVIDPLAQFVAGQARMVAAKLAFVTQSKAIDAGSAAATVGIKAGEAVAVTTANAVEAGSGAAAAVAPTPFIGPGLAAAAMAGTMAMVLDGLSNIKSAAGGFDIPAGINPLTQLHQKEMVLPAEHADTIRSLAGGGASSASREVVFKGQHVGQDFFMMHKNEIKNVIKLLNRNFELR